MSREEIYLEIEQTMGEVPGVFKKLSDRSLEIEYQTMKLMQRRRTVIPQKYLEMIGLGIAAARSSRYGVLWHREMAKAFGATEAEIEEALYFTKGSSGWSAYLQGIDYDYDEFRKEIRRAAEYVRRQQLKVAA